jgi:urea-proton symporter
LPCRICCVLSITQVFVDQSYWQCAIAATPTASWKGYLLGGLCWFAIPFSLATSLGLASVALSLPITLDESNLGLVPPAVAKHLMGTGGCLLILIMLFMAVVSTGAAELIAVSSVIAYDVYRTYINPRATGKQIVDLSRVVIVIFGLIMGVLGIVLNKIGIGLGWLYLFMGVLIGSAVFPVAFSISWRKCSAAGAISGALGGLVLGLGSWLAYAGFDGGVSVKNTGRDEIMLTGNLFAILGGGLICTVVSLIKPDNCDWTSTRSIALIEEDPHASLTKESEEDLERAMRLICMWGFGVTILLIVIWPILTLPVRAFPKGYFIFWVTISIVWGILATIAMVVLPVWESRSGILRVLMLKRKVPKTLGDDVVDEKESAAPADVSGDAN